MKNSFFMIVVILLLCNAGSPFASSQKIDSDMPKVNVTPTDEFREFAAQSFAASQQGDDQSAARFARILENEWDGGSGSLRLSSPALWTSADKAMDAFIDPLISYSTKPVNKDDVAISYGAYRKFLDQVDSVWVDKTLAVQQIASGVVIIVTKPGTGRQPKPGEIVTLKIRGFANDVEFKTSNPGDPDWIWLLADREPPGLIEAVTSLHAGESAVIVVPPGLGFGPKGSRKSAVPPNALLTYFVDVLDVKSHEINELLRQTMSAKGIDAAVDQFRTLRAQHFPDVLCTEQQVNGLGYDLLEKGDKEGAIKVFTLNAETFSDSANVFDSLAEAYAKNGQREEAIANYRKALAVNPNMQSSSKALKELESQ